MGILLPTFCRFSYHPLLLAILLTAAFALSIASSLDCVFLVVDVGFVAVNANTNPHSFSSEEFGVGIWSYEGVEGCVSLTNAAEEGGGASTDDDNYERSVWNDDLRWSLSRIMAICGAGVGVLVFVVIWCNVIQKRPIFFEFLTFAIIFAFLCEGVKFGLFFGILPCSATDFWFNQQDQNFHGAEQCDVGRGGFMCLASAGIYFLSMIFSSGYILRPVIYHLDDEDEEYSYT